MKFVIEIVKKKQVFLQSFNIPKCTFVGLSMGAGKKQPPEVLRKKGVLKNFRKFHRKTAVLRIPFSIVAVLRLATSLKVDSNTAIFL